MPEVSKLLSFVIFKYSDLSEEFSALKTTQNGPNLNFFLFFFQFLSLFVNFWALFELRPTGHQFFFSFWGSTEGTVQKN